MERILRARVGTTFRRAAIITIVLAIAGAFAVPVTASAGVMTTEHIAAAYDSFDSAALAGLVLEGDATVEGKVLQLTPDEGDSIGTAFIGQKVHLKQKGSFSTHFAFRMSSDGADGMAFVVRSGAGTTSGGGGGLGYDGTPGTSLAVEFDTYQNDWDNSDNHVDVDLYGTTHHPYPWQNYDPGLELNNGDIRYVWIDYTSENAIYVKISPYDSRPTTDLISVSGYQVLPSGQTEGDMYVGFTAATGGESQTHEILEWQFESAEHRMPPFFDHNAIDYVMDVAAVEASVSPALVPLGGTATLTYTARTATGTPVPGETLKLTAPAGGTLATDTVITGADGSVSVTYTAPASGRKAYLVRGVSTTALVIETAVPVGYVPAVVNPQPAITNAYVNFHADVAPGLTVTDAYDTLFQGARVRILNPMYGRERIYGYGTDSATETVLTLAEPATLATYQSWLRGIGYRGQVSGVTRQIEFSVFDGIAWSAPAIKTLKVLPPPIAATRVNRTVRASVSATGAQGVDAEGNMRDSLQGFVSPTGRWVVFYTGNKFAPEDTNSSGGSTGGQDWYLKDTSTGAISYVSMGIGSQASIDPIDGGDSGADVSADGRYVVFADWASNLIGGLSPNGLVGSGAFAVPSMGGDTNRASDVFYRDMNTGITTRISLTASGLQAKGSSYDPVMSATGRYVAFVSDVSLETSDTNDVSDVYLKDMVTGSIRRVSVSSAGATGDARSVYPSISADGRFIAFESNASNLVSGDTNEGADVFVHDTATGETTRVSLSDGGDEIPIDSVDPSISDDGRFVAFASNGTTLTAGDTNRAYDVFVRDRVAGRTVAVSVGAGGVPVGAWTPSISGSGRYVAFSSIAPLVAGDVNDSADIYVRDMVRGVTTIASLTQAKTSTLDDSYDPDISSDGLTLSYVSEAENIVGDDTNGSSDVFVARLTPALLAPSGTGVGRPWTRWIAPRNRKTLVYGYLGARHAAGSHAVTLRCYRMEKGVWVLRKTVAMPATRTRAGHQSKYADYVSFPLAGRWKLVAIHAHAGHEPDVSGSRYFWVR
ncbi:MAG: hypothetical protein Q7W30_01730 [Coriobacteriia bacterium]|nr:hypothetical protein [Coriobacteriia bacterium]